MTANQITKRLTKDILIGLVINTICTFFFVRVVYGFKAGSFEGKQAVTIFSLLGAGWAMFLTVCSITILLNVRPEIRNDKLYRFLSYYLLPLLAVVIVAILKISDSDMLSVFLIINVPFFVIQTIFFIRFVVDVNQITTIDPVEKPR